MVVRALALVASVAILCSSVFTSCGGDQAPEQAIDAPTETTGVTYEPMALAREALARDAPKLAALVHATETADVAGVFALLRFQEFECVTPVGAKADGRFACSKWGVPERTVVQGFPEDVGYPNYLPETIARPAIENLLGGGPELEFVARLAPTEYFLSFELHTPRAGRYGDTYGSFYFVAHAAEAAPVVVLGYSLYRGATGAVEKADQWEVAYARPYEVLGASPDLLRRSDNEVRPRAFGRYSFAVHGQGAASGAGEFLMLASSPHALVEVQYAGPGGIQVTLVCGSWRSLVIRSPAAIPDGQGLLLANLPTGGPVCTWEVDASGSWRITAR